MADNEPPQQPEPQQPPPDFDAEQVRQFQEFQRFQEYQRFVQAQRGQPAAGQQPGGELVPAPSQPPAHPPQVAGELAGLRAQLAELTAGQQRIERAANPPWWRRLLRGRLVHWVIVLAVLAVLVIFGLPALANHYLGGSSQPPGGPAGELPAPKTQSHELIQKATDTVAEVYRAIAQNAPGQFCFLFDPATAQAFGRAFGASGCEAAVPLIYRQLQPGQLDTYGNPDLTQVPEPTSQQTTTTISSCAFDVTGGPRLGTFTLTRVADNGWEITGYAAQQPCPPTPTGATPTS